MLQSIDWTTKLYKSGLVIFNIDIVYSTMKHCFTAVLMEFYDSILLSLKSTSYMQILYNSKAYFSTKYC
jgi:hypothetical protein